jgi:hypothetical protein
MPLLSIIYKSYLETFQWHASRLGTSGPCFRRFARCQGTRVRLTAPRGAKRGVFFCSLMHQSNPETSQGATAPSRDLLCGSLLGPWRGPVNWLDLTDDPKPRPIGRATPHAYHSGTLYNFAQRFSTTLNNGIHSEKQRGYVKWKWYEIIKRASNTGGAVFQ